MNGIISSTSFAEAIGVVAVYSVIRDVIPRLFGRKNDCLTVSQHDKECDLKLKPIYKRLDDIHSDVRTLLQASGVRSQD